jgi:hypothetical protein
MLFDFSFYKGTAGRPPGTEGNGTKLFVVSMPSEMTTCAASVDEVCLSIWTCTMIQIGSCLGLR